MTTSASTSRKVSDLTDAQLLAVAQNGTGTYSHATRTACWNELARRGHTVNVMTNTDLVHVGRSVGGGRWAMVCGSRVRSFVAPVGIDGTVTCDRCH